jgi:hypothetical protein
MATLLSIAEAVEQSKLSHEHIATLARSGKIAARKAGKFWLIELESLQAYEAEMEELGTKKHSPKPRSSDDNA